MGEEVDLRLESISLHVLVKVFKVRIIGVGLKKRFQFVSTSQKLDEGTLTTADIACHCDVFDSGHAHFLKKFRAKHHQ